MMCLEASEQRVSTSTGNFDEEPPIFSKLIDVNVNFLLLETNSSSISPFMLTKQQTDTLKQGVVNRTGLLYEKLRNLLFMKTSENSQGDSSQRLHYVESIIKESQVAYQNAKTHSSNAFYYSLTSLAQILKQLNDLLLTWDKNSISCSDAKFVKMRKLCIQAENSLSKLKLLEHKLMREIYDTKSKRKLNENKEHLDMKHNKVRYSFSDGQVLTLR